MLEANTLSVLSQYPEFKKAGLYALDSVAAVIK